MKKIVCILITFVMVLSSAAVPTFAMQEDVKKAYINELKWISKTYENAGKYPGVIYSAYDIDKDGIKELIIHNGTSLADISYTVYTCEYGKIIRLGDVSGSHSEPYECDINGFFMYAGHMAIEILTRVSKNGHSLNETQIFYTDLNPLLKNGYEDIPWHRPKRPMKTYEAPDYSGLY